MKILKKFGIFLIPAVLAVSAISITTSCPEDGFVPPPAPQSSEAYVFLNLGQPVLGRTILPEFTMGTFKSYKLVLEQNGTEIVSRNLTSSSLASPIILAPGNYDIKLTGYLGTDSVTNPVAYAEELGHSITAGANSVTLILQAYNPNDPQMGDTGIFDYSITLSNIAGLDEAVMTISGGDLTLDIEVDLNNNTTTSDMEELTPGFYTVDFYLATDGSSLGEDAVLEFSQELWIYKNLTSSFTMAFNNASFGPQKVEFNLNNDDLDGTGNKIYDSYTTVGGIISTANAPAIPYSAAGSIGTPPRPVYLISASPDVYYAFDGWYLDDGNGDPSATAFTIGAGGTQILGETKVVGKWEQLINFTPIFDIGTVGGTPMEVEYTINGGTPLPVGLGGNITISGTESNDVVFTVKNSAAYVSNSIEWAYNVNSSVITVQDADLKVIDSALLTAAKTANSFVRNTVMPFEYLIQITAEEKYDDDNDPGTPDISVTQSFWFRLTLQQMP